jgi:biofilm PGA synthesis protein PgaA
MQTKKNWYIWTFVNFFIFIFISFTQAESSSHEEAVALARAGKINEAVEQLEILQKQNPDDNEIVNDLIVIYYWNGQLEKSCFLFEQRDPKTYPRYVQLAAQKAYRDLRKPDHALEIVALLLDQQENDPDLLLTKGLLLVDKKKFDAAENILNAIEKTAGKDQRYYLLSAYIHTSQQHWLPALSDYQHLRKLLPDDPDPSAEQFFVLRDILAGWAAEDFLKKNKIKKLTDHELAKLFMNQSAVKLRWSTHVAENIEEKRLLALKGLSLHIKALEFLNSKEGGTQWPHFMIYDIIVALRNLGQVNDAENIYNYLIKQGEVPEYVKIAAADAILSNRKPKKSIKIYQDILNKNPKSHESLSGLFYSLIEDSKFNEAIYLIETAISREPAFRLQKNSKVYPYNERYLELNVYKVMASLYADQLEEAWFKADEFVRNAPANTWLHEIRGEVAVSRGWTRQALQDYNYASLLEPDNVDILSRKTSALIQLGEYQNARQLLHHIVKEYPQEEFVEKVWNEWLFSQKSEFWADISWSRISGDKFGGERMTASSEVLSMPLNDFIFIEASYRFSWEKFSEESEEGLNSYSSGISCRNPDWNFTGRISYNDSSRKSFGGSMKAVWSPDDFWMLSVAGERFSMNTPLRALHQDIRADTLAGEMNYRWSELRNFSSGIEKNFFTDGNSGIAGHVSLTQRLFDIPYFEVDGRTEIYASKNDIENDTYYFLPVKDMSIKGCFNFNHIYYHNYDDTLKHVFDFGYGVYKQDRYDDIMIGHISYSHHYESSEKIEIKAGFEVRWNAYDGNSEINRIVTFLVNWKF